MNPNDFKRDIVSRHVRAAGDAPGIGRISRMHESADPLTGGGRMRRRSHGKNKHDHKWLSLVFGLVALMILLGAVVLWLVPMVQRGRSASVNRMAGPGNREADIRVVSRFASPSKDEAIMLVEAALANRDPELVGKIFRMGSATVGEIVAFCAEAEKRDGKFDGCQWLSSIDSPEALLEGVVANFNAADGSVNQRLALLTPDSNGLWQVDFEALAREVSPSWDEILKPGTEKALVRVNVAPDFYYNGVFRDESVWTSFGMSSPDLDFLIRGYCRKDSPVDQEIRKIFNDGSKSARATLEIRHVEGGEAKQFEITRLLAHDWVLPATKSSVGSMQPGS